MFSQMFAALLFSLQELHATIEQAVASVNIVIVFSAATQQRFRVRGIGA